MNLRTVKSFSEWYVCVYVCICDVLCGCYILNLPVAQEFYVL